ncbi:MAG: HIT domain-containing protein [Candidatus Dojkabacteria bacterium]
MTIFEKIAKREIPAKIIWQDDDCIAFLDINPLNEGHTLVTPKENWGDYIFDLDDDKYQKLMDATKEVAELLKQKLKCEKVIILVEGFEVPHVHIKLVPSNGDFTLSEGAGKPATEEELERIYNKIVG